jgi:hypothetical protein
MAQRGPLDAQPELVMDLADTKSSEAASSAFKNPEAVYDGLCK